MKMRTQDGLLQRGWRWLVKTGGVEMAVGVTFIVAVFGLMMTLGLVMTLRDSVFVARADEAPAREWASYINRCCISEDIDLVISIEAAYGKTRTLVVTMPTGTSAEAGRVEGDSQAKGFLYKFQDLDQIPVKVYDQSGRQLASFTKRRLY